MKTTITTITTIAVLAVLASAGPAAAAKTVTYKGKTSAGYPITIKVKGAKLKFIEGGIRTQCLPIQGGGRPMGGSEIFGLQGTMPMKRHQSHTLQGKPAFHWREVTQKHDIWLKRGNRKLSGRLRLQYQFMVSKFPIGTFSIYSCLGGAKFKARA